MRAFRLVATDKGIFDESSFNRFHCGAPHRIDRADEPHEWHQQDRRIQVLRPLRLHKRPQIVIPEARKDVLSYRVAGALPVIERPRKRTFLGKAQCSIETHPAHQTRVQEFSPPPTNLPYTSIVPLPLLTH